MFSRTFWGSGRPGSNRRPSAWETDTGRRSPVRSGVAMSHGDGRFSRSTGSRLFRLYRRVPKAGCGVLATILTVSLLGCAPYADAKPWPKNPTLKQVRDRVGEYNWKRARQIAICETGARLNWYLDLKTGRPLGQYVSAMGMYYRTFAYGQAQTGLRGRNWHEQVAIAVAAHAITGGWSGWSCA